MLSDVVTILAATISGVAAVLATMLGVFLTRRRRTVLTYNVSSMPLLRSKPKPYLTVKISTDKSSLTGKDSDRGADQVISDAYIFEINLQNTGKEDITSKTDIAIQLNEAAKIIGCQIDSGNPYQAEAKKGGEPNIIIITFPHFKAKNQALIRLISTENKDRTCEVDAIGSRIQARPKKYPTTFAIVGTSISAIGLLILYGFILEVGSNHLTNDSFAVAIGLVAFGMAGLGSYMLYDSNPYQAFSSLRESSPSLEWDNLQPKNKKN